MSILTCIVDSAAGDGCFYIGLGGKSALPNPPLEPYQCCPTKGTRGTKKTSSEKRGGPASQKKATKDTAKFGKGYINSASSNVQKQDKGNKPKKGILDSKFIWWW